MKKLFAWCKRNALFVSLLALLAFIPLYPKLPLINIRHTWVYVRLEDFLVLLVLLYWLVLVMQKKIALKTPLTVPVFLFWLVGALATIHGMLFIFPTLREIYPNVVFLSFLRRMEYMSVFFIAYAAIKDKRQFPLLVSVLVATFLAVVVYGIGQRYFGLPAFLTMNEEFAKGIPIQLSQLSRVSSTFGGHYDLAAYLVLIIPIIVSMMFHLPNWVVRALLATTALLGVMVLFMTVSRISLLALLLGLVFVLFMQKKKLVFVLLPIVILFGLLFVSLYPGIFSRFGNTVKQIDVIVDAQTGGAIGHPKIVPKTYFVDKIVRQQFSRSITSLYTYASPAAMLVIPYAQLDNDVVLLKEPDAPTGEDLPQGTGYVNLALSPVTQKLGNFLYEPKPKVATTSAEVFVINGNYLLKKVLAYDLSFTTRFQGEWPRALATFQKNIFIGSGYGSMGLAVDNSYLRMLAETGLMGLGIFIVLFIITGLYVRRTLPYVDSPHIKSFVIGFIAGTLGLAVNAFFIDVFEASKVAFTLWLLTGITLALLRLYRRSGVAIMNELRRIATSTPAVIVLLFALALLLYSPMTRNNFVGDDYTWLRWAADCGNRGSTLTTCRPNVATIFNYFIHSEGFFYRPGTKIYVLLMYTIFSLNQTAYHIVSLVLHASIAVLVFLLAKKIFKHLLPSVVAACLFIILSGYSEAVQWISATGFLFAALFSLSSLLCYIFWLEKGKARLLAASLLSMTFALAFHEVGIVTPFFLLAYQKVFSESSRIRKILFAPIVAYLAIRYIAHSHWFSGDYSYNVFRLPFNAVGNTLGYIFLTLIGPISLPFYQLVRNAFRVHIVIAGMGILIAGAIAARSCLRAYRALRKEDQRIVLFGFLFFIIGLVPFLGLGNMTSRYSYISSIGLIFIALIALKKLFSFLMVNGKVTAVLGVAVAVSVFSLLQLVEHQQITSDWYEAGEKTRKFIVAMNAAYEGWWAREPVELHFVNVPIRYGEAWVFPVGIPDALWLVFPNAKIRVFIWPTLRQAFDAVAYDAPTQRVFEFDQNGLITERRKLQTQ